ncbi:putative 1-phosphatidylinositol-3-phosphate 5-kinase FAB1C [Platanthera guangdongensis]|uniref:1-phosphatidylinositol-3-phosphate 5-kinase FAB1C n=1 Tax=Platanthera guangdongensis TaxID=2320717 RepID=A0ABR2MCK3_9ASPA
MVSQHKNPRVLLLGGALEYQRVSNKLASINTVIEQESDHLKMVVAKNEARRPNVLLVEKSVSSYAQEYLLVHVRVFSIGYTDKFAEVVVGSASKGDEYVTWPTGYRPFHALMFFSPEIINGYSKAFYLPKLCVDYTLALSR